MVGYLANIWRLRYFWSSLVRIDLRNRYRRSVLGIGWSLLHPILMTTVLCAVFCPLLGADYRTFAPYLLAGLAFWNFLVSTASQGCHCFIQGESYIRQQAAPLAIYPLRTVLGTAIHGLAALSVVLTFTWVVQGFSSVPALLSLIPTLGLMLLLGWSKAACCGMLNVVFQDTQHLIEVLFQILFYLTPVMYPAKMLAERKMEWLVKWNPLASFLELIRAPILEGHLPSPHAFGVTLGVVTIMVVIAGSVLARLERRLVFYL
jgi:ABC-type polysaccharide/polyol phosphate export permease